MPPRKTKQNETNEPVVQAAVQPTEKKTTTKKTEKKTVEKPASTEKPVVKKTKTPVTATAPVEKKTREKPTKESILAEFDVLGANIDVEIEEMRKSDKKVKGVKFLQQMRKQQKDFRKRLCRVLRVRQKSSNQNAGFTRPVEISTSMRKFIDQADPSLKGKTVSRIDVTRTINAFIKSNNLQNPEDRKAILWEKNPNLKTLFNEVGPADVVTYFTMHRFLKNHFTTMKSAAAASAPSTTTMTATVTSSKK
jgi:chromatin remodeling complex protein RSC6